MYLQLDFRPSLWFDFVVIGLFFRFRTGADDISIPIIPKYGWNLDASSFAHLSGKTVKDNNQVSQRVSIPARGGRRMRVKKCMIDARRCLS